MNVSGGLTHLLKYESERQRHIVPVMATVDGLNRLYSTNNTALVLLRSLGLTATNALGPLKVTFLQHITYINSFDLFLSLFTIVSHKSYHSII